MHQLFDEVLTLLSGQENSGAFSQSVDERHLLATVSQLQGLHPGNQSDVKHLNPSWLIKQSRFNRFKYNLKAFF